MSKRWLILFLLAITSVLIVCFVYGLAAAVYPSALVLTFSGFFLIAAWSDSFQASVTPGLKKLNEPEWPWSRVYFAWLYVNDMERWVSYTIIISYLIGSILGALLGWFILLPLKVSFSTSFASWLSGMFLMLSIAELIATSDYSWIKHRYSPGWPWSREYI